MEMVAGGVSLSAVQLILSLAHTVYPHTINLVEIVKESLVHSLEQLVKFL